MEYHSGLEVVPFERHQFQEPGQTHPQVAPNKHEDPEAVSGESDNTESLESGTNSGLGEEKIKRKCGLPVRLFYAVSIIAILLTLSAIAGGVAGSIKSRTKPNLHTDDDKSDDKNENILVESRLAAANWTDPNGFTHRFIFFQDPSSAIIARRWDSQNHTWATINLTAVMGSSRTPISSLGPSTPLASSASYYQDVWNELHLYYLTPENTVASVSLYNLTNEPNDWVKSPITDLGLATIPGSQLASAWSRCWGDSCGRGNGMLLYQRPDGAVNIVNQSDIFNPITVLESRSIARNSSLAMIAEVDFDVPANGLTRLTFMSESLETPDLGTAQQTLYYTDHWASGDYVLRDTNLPPPSPKVQFAISTLDNFNSPIFMSLLPDGSVTCEMWKAILGHWIGIPSVEFRGGPSTVNFSAIAATEEAMLYGVSGDQILQYSISNTDPPQFDYVGTVYP
ncbi:hypothetical protein GGR51DRAFT_574524 [Nemania sp. FL0031]|nr:hypothetical protein GGR51DRAFT_574524 [Nemania sp. FL0031]